jgi:hypothetical protein
VLLILLVVVIVYLLRYLLTVHLNNSFLLQQDWLMEDSTLLLVGETVLKRAC